jgi:dethiobiotin synthetase
MTQLTPPRGLFIAGTDTGIGKTFVTARIAETLYRQGHRVGVYKPVASGCQFRGGQLISDDAQTLWQAAGSPDDLSAVCPQLFQAPLAPPLAARLEGRNVDQDLLRSGLRHWLNCSDIVLVEGAGGLMSPVSDDDYVADLAFEFGFPLIVVAADALGVINQTLQTLITATTFREGLDVAGVVLDAAGPPADDDPSVATNRDELRQRCVPPILTRLDWGADDFDTQVDWFALARAGRRFG